MKRIGIIGAALFAAGALWAAGEGPSVTLNRVQQRYPWNGKVDIDFTIANVSSPDDYYVRLKIVKPGGSTVILHEFEDDTMLCSPTNGANQRVTWDSSWEDQECRFLGKNATVQAELVFCGGDKQNAPYGARYVVVDLTDPTSYPVTNLLFHSLVAATNYFNTDEFKDSKMAFRRIRCGSFVMGSPTDEVGRTACLSGKTVVYTNGIPVEVGRMGETQHKVTLTENFLIGVFPLTVRQWERIMGQELKSNSLKKYAPMTQGTLTTEVQVGLSWNTLRGERNGVPAGDPTPGSPLGLLNARVMAVDPTTRLKFDLPTDSQWEYACRAGTTGAIYNASIDYTNWNELQTIVGGDGNSSPYGGGVVGRYAPNPWGLYDMLGVAMEICLDRVTSDTHDWGEDAVIDPCLDAVSVRTVCRGGAYYINGVNIGDALHVSAFRSAARFKRQTSDQNTYIGCRFACTLKDSGTN